MSCVDPEHVVREHLLANTALENLVGSRVWAGNDWAAGYSPADGPAIRFKARGGQDAYHDATVVVSMQYEVCAESLSLARETARALYDALHNQSGRGIRMSRREVVDQLLPSPEPGWYVVLCQYKHWLINSGETA